MSKTKSFFCDHCFCKIAAEGNECCKCGRSEKEYAISNYIDNYPQWNDGNKPFSYLSDTLLNERLLKDDEICLAAGFAPSTQLVDCYERAISSAQDAKTSKWWIEKIELSYRDCSALTCKYGTPDCSFLNVSCGAWQEIIKEVS